MIEILHPITGDPVQKEFIHTIKEAVKATKDLQDVFKPEEEPTTITTTSHDHAKNLENAKEFGKVGVKGKWVHKEEK